MDQALISKMATEVVQTFKSKPTWNYDDLTALGKPLLDYLTTHLKLQSVFIEWRGVAEHLLVPIFDYHEVTGLTFCHNVNPDGSIDTFGV